ncbi:MAG: thermonuclease family protein [Acidobacteriota bacterium]|jgi:micrococcal nuclease|nr:thermonuclease family protein [Acidobacteriota bacterium]
MKKAVFSLMVVFLACTALRAQSLGELARLEQERRDSIPDGEDESNGSAQNLVVSAVNTHINSNYSFLNRCKVTKVVDGDTIYTDCLTESIRLIGVDTPETVKPDVQCYGVEASSYTRQQLEGKYIYLESDPSQGDYDKYHRLLRYVYTADGVNFNLQLVLEGYGHEYTYNAPYKYQTQFKQAQDNAKARRAGFWSYATCGGQTGRTSSAASDSKGQLLFTTPAPPVTQNDQKPRSKTTGTRSVSRDATGSRGPEYWYGGNHCVKIPNDGDWYECTRPNGSTYRHTGYGR